MYDAVIGRWLLPDPARQYWSPYMAFGNDPINRVDPNGGTDNPFGEGCRCIDVETGPASHFDILTGTTWFDFDFTLLDVDIPSQALNALIAGPPQEATAVPLPLALPLLESVGLGAIAEAIDNAISVTDESLAHGVQYSLRASKAGYYPSYEWGKKNPVGLKWLEAHDVWKIGETTRFNRATLKQYRYSETWLKSMNLNFVPEFTGNILQIKTVQNLKIIQYSISNFNLPATCSASPERDSET